MKELNEVEKIELEIEREKQNLREWKRKVQISEMKMMRDVLISFLKVYLNS